MKDRYNPALVHNTLCDAYNSSGNGSMKCELPSPMTFMQAMTQNRMKDEVIDSLHSALKIAKETIKNLHNMDGGRAEIWDIFDNHSPEMKMINA